MSAISLTLCSICNTEERPNSPLLFTGPQGSLLAHTKCVEHSVTPKSNTTTTADMRTPSHLSNTEEEPVIRRRSTSVSQNLEALRAAKRYGKSSTPTSSEESPKKPPLLRRAGGLLANLPTASSLAQTPAQPSTEHPRIKSASSSRLPSIKEAEDE